MTSGSCLRNIGLLSIGAVIIFAISCSTKKNNPTNSENTAPDPPALDSASGAPGYQSTGRALVDTLYWTCSDSDGDALTYDVYFGTDDAPPIVSEAQTGTSYITDSLKPYTKYYWRIMAKDGHGHESLSWIWNFITFATVPEVTTKHADSTAYRNSWAGGTVVSGRGSPMTARGVCWSTNPAPTISDMHATVAPSLGIYLGAYDCVLTGLTPSTKYYYRAYATNGLGTGYGSVDSITTLDAFGTVTDIDGNVYPTVNIFGKWWMAENLVVSHYRNGDSIPYVSVDSVWSALNTDAYCYYANDPTHAAIFGAMYNWYAVADNRGLAPEGWHVSTNEEWQELIDSAGGAAVAGGKLKKKGGQYWYVPNTGATDEYSFAALGAGFRNFQGFFLGQGDYEDFWTSLSTSSTDARRWNLSYDNAGIYWCERADAERLLGAVCEGLGGITS